MRDSVIRFMPLVLTIAILAFFAWMVRVVLSPVLIAGLFVIVLAPVNTHLEKKLGARSRFAPMLTTLLTFLVILAPTVLIAVLTVQQVRGMKTSGFFGSVQTLTEQLIRWAQSSGRFLSLFGVDMSTEGLRTFLDDSVQTVLTRVGELAGVAASAAPDLVIGIFLFVIAFYFWLKDGKTLLLWLEEVLPFPQQETQRLYALVKSASRGVVIGQMFTGAVQAGLTLIALFSLRVPGAFLWGMFAFVLSFIPLFGTAPVTLGAAIYLFAVGRPISAVIMLVLVFVIGASDNIVRPIAQSSNGDMHPLVSLIAIFGGLATLGASGVFLGPIAAALALWAIEMQGRMRGSEVE